MEFFLAQILFKSGTIVLQWNRNVTFKDPKIKGSPGENICMIRNVGTN